LVLLVTRECTAFDESAVLECLRPAMWSCEKEAVDMLFPDVVLPDLALINAPVATSDEAEDGEKEVGGLLKIILHEK
jgi:hypothetical protein